MKYIATLLVLFGFAVLPLQAKDDAEKTDTKTEQTDSADKKDGKSEAELKQEKREATRILTADLKDKTHIVSLLKKVKDRKSADKIGKQLVKELGDAPGKKTAMGETGPAKRPTGPAMKEVEKKFKAKIQKLDEDIADHVKRIEDLKIESDDIQTAIKLLPKPTVFSEDEPSDDI